MAGRPPDDVARQFAQDTLTMTTHELAEKYQIAESTVKDWRLFCKCNLEMEVGYGKPLTFINKKEDPGEAVRAANPRWIPPTEGNA